APSRSSLSMYGDINRQSGSSISTAPLQYRPHNIYGGAGGSGIHISQSGQLLSSGSPPNYVETGVIDNEKVTMQNLNDRMASYLDKVRNLEAANTKLELQIREFYERRASTVCRDFTKYFATITDLRAQVLPTLYNRLINNPSTELNMRNSIEVDVACLKRVRDSLTRTICDLHMQVEGLKEELVCMKSRHEEIHLARTQRSGEVSVEVDTTDSVDLLKTLEEMREQYESVVLKNRLEVEKWYTKQINTATTEVKTFNIELVELKRRHQEYEITRQTLVTTLNHRFGNQLSQMQVTINALETELQQLRVSIEKQQCEYNLLLDIKMRLELEIAEYRRLLDGEHQEIFFFITEKLIDGQVVSTSVETKEENIQ
uniref:IF rod domain-containing protein n=1 Tax=Mola mola TaxID=94237 RepID=A0A3Q4AYJ0_MOLML